MATLSEIRQNPSEYLGTSDDEATDAEGYELFYAAVEKLLTDDEGLTEEEACDRVFGHGDFVRNAHRILGAV